MLYGAPPLCADPWDPAVPFSLSTSWSWQMGVEVSGMWHLWLICRWWSSLQGDRAAQVLGFFLSVLIFPLTLTILL
jgi:hypothetical protein